ncbi:hypothetical protein ASF04_06505 [Duganella sp. Leaf61]|nr:hypothetical protein ASF04_06505 [Duganella sp. Leaf61]
MFRILDVRLDQVLMRIGSHPVLMIATAISAIAGTEQIVPIERALRVVVTLAKMFDMPVLCGQRSFAICTASVLHRVEPGPDFDTLVRC